MRDVHVAHFKASTFAGQAAWAKCRYAALVRDLGQGVGLVHELRQLRGAEELFQRRRDRLRVDQIVRHQRLLLGLTKTLFDGFFDTCQTGAVLVLSQLTHATHAAVAQVVDIVNLTTAIAQVNQDFGNAQDVFVGQHHRAC